MMPETEPLKVASALFVMSNAAHHFISATSVPAPARLFLFVADLLKLLRMYPLLQALFINMSKI